MGSSKIQAIDERQDIVVPGGASETYAYCAQHFITAASSAIKDHGYFAVALSGGSTPKAIFTLLARDENRSKVDWNKVLLFWSDERAVPPDHPDSNYHMAIEAGLGKLGIPPEHIFRMPADYDIEANALEYESEILEKLPGGSFDMVMLGMGDDGHTASLFPQTHGLHVQDRLVIANYVPQLNTWRMSLTFPCINKAKTIVIYVIGKGKSEMLKKVLSEKHDPDQLPIQSVGTPAHRALWIADSDAASLLEFS